MRTTILALLATALLAAPTRAAVQTYRIDPGDDQKVVFTSKAPMETFEGKTHKVHGTIVADLANLADSVQVRVVVDMASLSTGIGMRDNHMRDRHLETKKYPEAVFTGGRVVSCAPSQLAPGGKAHAVVAGIFDLHGVARPVEMPVDLALDADGTLSVQVAFPVKLSDHAIERPKVLVLKLADEQQVSIALHALPVEPTP